jgi:hypothetical protein
VIVECVPQKPRFRSCAAQAGDLLLGLGQPQAPHAQLLAAACGDALVIFTREGRAAASAQPPLPLALPAQPGFPPSRRLAWSWLRRGEAGEARVWPSGAAEREMRLDWEAQRAPLDERVERTLDFLHKLFVGGRRSGRNDGGEG